MEIPVPDPAVVEPTPLPGRLMQQQHPALPPEPPGLDTVARPLLGKLDETVAQIQPRAVSYWGTWPFAQAERSLFASGFVVGSDSASQ